MVGLQVGNTPLLAGLPALRVVWFSSPVAPQSTDRRARAEFKNHNPKQNH
jgi:hypothetical protein